MLCTIPYFLKCFCRDDVDLDKDENENDDDEEEDKDEDEDDLCFLCIPNNIPL